MLDMTTAVVIPSEELTTEKVLEIFRNAYMDAGIDGDGDLHLRIEGVKMWVKTDPSRRLMSVRAGYGLKPETSRSSALELANRINDDLVFIRACVPSGMSSPFLYLDHYIDITGGVTGQEVVGEVRRFHRLIRGLSDEDIENLFV